MKLSKLLLASGILLMSIYTAEAQRTTKSAEAMELRKSTYMDKLADELDLTEKQKAEIEKMHKKYAAERGELVKENQKIREEHRAKMKGISEKERADLDRILTAEQQAKLKALKEEKKAERTKHEFKGKRYEGKKQEFREEKKIE